MKKITQRQLAARFDVSQSAICQVLKDPDTGCVAPMKRNEILTYLRRHAPEMLKAKPVRTMCFLAQRSVSSDNIFYTRVLEGAEEEAGRRNCHLLFKRRETEDDLLTAARAPSTCGIIHFGGLDPDSVSAVRKHKPIVVVNSSYEQLMCDNVNIDNHSGIHQAVRELIASGCSQLRYLGDSGQSGPCRGHSIERFGAFFEALIQNNLPLLANFSDMYSNSIDDLLEAQVKPDGIVCFNDSSAISALKAIQHRGFSVPEDIRIIGFDDIREGFESTPALSTVHQDRETMGREAVRLLDDRIDFPQKPFVKVICETRLLVRNT